MKFVIKIIKRVSNDASIMLSEMHLQGLIEPLKHDGLISLHDHIIDDEYEYLVRPFYNLGSITDML